MNIEYTRPPLHQPLTREGQQRNVRAHVLQTPEQEVQTGRPNSFSLNLKAGLSIAT